MRDITKPWQCARCKDMHGTTCEMTMLDERILNLEEWTIHAEENIYIRLKKLEEKIDEISRIYEW